MAKPCEICDGIPWENIKNWRLVDGEDDLRPIVDLARLNRESCLVCRAIGNRPYRRRLRKLTYCDAAEEHAEAYDGFLSAESDLTRGHSRPLPFSLGVFGGKSPHTSYQRNSFVDYQALLKSRTECTEGWSRDHARCGPEAAPGIHNMVVIDCEGNNLVLAAADCKYLALSYVWGTHSEKTHDMSLPRPTRHVLSTTSKVVESASFPYARRTMPGRVPRVVYDAIVVTRELGFRYLWIDRYCIDQQDADTKHQQIQQMWSIYASAYITLVAAAGNGPNYGLPGVSLPRRQDRLQRGAVTMADNSSIHGEIYQSKWSGRAWTFQENLASRRKIFFTDLGASYACEAYFRTDLGQTVLQDAEYLDDDSYIKLQASLGADGSTLQGYEKIAVALSNVEAYCARSLTYDSDSLNAIMGMFVRLSQSEVDPVDHVWGTLLIPVKSLSGAECYQLCLYWHHESPPRRRNGFPTWSPLAWEGWLIHYSDHPHYQQGKDQIDGCNGFDPAHKIYLLQENGDIDINTYAHSRRDILGRIKAGVTSSPAPTLLKFGSARVLPLSLEIKDGNFFTEYEVAVQQSDTEDLVLASYWDSEPHGLEVGLIGIVLFDSGNGDVPIMVLKPLKNHYERIGMAHVAAKDRKSGPQKCVEYVRTNLRGPCAFWSEYTEDIIVG